MLNGLHGSIQRQNAIGEGNISKRKVLRCQETDMVAWKHSSYGPSKPTMHRSKGIYQRVALAPLELDKLTSPLFSLGLELLWGSFKL